MSDKIDGLGKVDRIHNKGVSPAEAPSVGSAEARAKGVSGAAHSHSTASTDHIEVDGAHELHHGSALADAFKTPDKGIFVRGEHRPLPKDLDEKSIKKLCCEKSDEHKHTLEKDMPEHKCMSTIEKASLEKHDGEKHDGEKHGAGLEKGLSFKEKDKEKLDALMAEKHGEHKQLLNEKGLAQHGEKGVLLEKGAFNEKGNQPEKRHMEKDCVEKPGEKGLQLEKHGEKGLQPSEKSIEKENWEKALHPEKHRPEKDVEKGGLEKGQLEKHIEKENWEKAVHPEKGIEKMNLEKGLRLEKSEEKWIEKLSCEKNHGEKDLEIQPLKQPEAVATMERFFF